MAGNIRVGDIFWVDGFPPLDGTHAGRRPVVVIECADDDPVIVVGVTTDRSAPDRIDLPNLEDEPGATTGLPARCCAIPRWIVSVQRARLLPHARAGRLPLVTLEALADAVDAVLSEWPPPDDPTPAP